MIMGPNDKIGKGIWAEAVHTDKYIRNRLITRSEWKICTPYEIMHGRKPDLSKMQHFGYTSFVHIPKKIRKGTFSQRAEKGILVDFCK